MHVEYIKTTSGILTPSQVVYFNFYSLPHGLSTFNDHILSILICVCNKIILIPCQALYTALMQMPFIILRLQFTHLQVM